MEDIKTNVGYTIIVERELDKDNLPIYYSNDFKIKNNKKNRELLRRVILSFFNVNYFGGESRDIDDQIESHFKYKGRGDVKLGTLSGMYEDLDIIKRLILGYCECGDLKFGLSDRSVGYSKNSLSYPFSNTFEYYLDVYYIGRRMCDTYNFLGEKDDTNSLVPSEICTDLYISIDTLDDKVQVSDKFLKTKLNEINKKTLCSIESYRPKWEDEYRGYRHYIIEQ